jgi:hypothetical protein
MSNIAILRTLGGFYSKTLEDEASSFPSTGKYVRTLHVSFLTNLHVKPSPAVLFLSEKTWALDSTLAVP